jgi:hypothetical protein
MADFNPVSMSVYPLCGHWTEQNTLGITIEPRGKIERDFKTYKHRLQAKDNERNINFLKYVAFLWDPKHRKKLADGGYESQKEKAYKRSQMLSQSGRDIGDLPEVSDPERKESCARNFRLFCETYFSHIFDLEWSEDHLKVISRIENSVLEGGLFALAMPRGSGKSSLCEAGGVWAILYGHREFVTLIGATEGAAMEMMESIKTELESNEMLAEDFPEVCYPIKQLEGIANRCAGQLYHGVRTRITWTSNEVVLPTIKGSPASGMIIRVAGLTGRIRGMKFKRSDGRSVRPNLVIVDDPQTTESANSIEQTRKRLRILNSDVLGLAGPGKKIAGLMPCTIIRVGDMADQVLDRGKHPEWNGERMKMMYSPPSNVKLWEEYSEIRADSLREDGNILRATEFYKQHRDEMDAGAVMAWAARFNHDEASALQHAMNLKLTDELSFQAEYQNDPMPEDSAEDTLLSVDEICAKLNGLKRNVIPLECVRLTMFVDIQKTLLYWMVCAWSDNFSGAVIDYGAWPDQGRNRFSLADANPTMQHKFPKAGLEGQIYGSLEALFQEKMTQIFVREDGAEMRIERAMIDANWGLSTDVVYQYCRQSAFSGIILPGHGRYVGASSRPMTEYKKKRGDRVGFNWYMPTIAGKRAVRHVVFDTNFWKSFVHSRLSVMQGDAGCLSLFGRNPLYHQLLAEHLTAEYRVRTQGLGRTVDEWKIRPQRGDNHWLDCLAGCAVAASIQGSALAEQLSAAATRVKVKLSGLSDNRTAPEPVLSASASVQNERKRLKLSEIQRVKR